jgi:hypothetical protein
MFRAFEKIHSSSKFIYSTRLGSGDREKTCKSKTTNNQPVTGRSRHGRGRYI